MKPRKVKKPEKRCGICGGRMFSDECTMEKHIQARFIEDMILRLHEVVRKIPDPDLAQTWLNVSDFIDAEFHPLRRKVL